MRCLLSAAAPTVLVAALLSSVGVSQGPNVPAGKEKSKGPTSNQLLMRDKLLQMNRVLEGITLDKFDVVADAAATLRMISRATSWHIVDPTPRYGRLSKDFQEQAADLERHAAAKNGDAATLDLVRLNITCAQCHQHMREQPRPRPRHASPPSAAPQPPQGEDSR